MKTKSKEKEEVNIDLDQLPVEDHPFEPFLPKEAKVLIMGTFPPTENRHAINFYYPNPINDFWRIMGLIFEDDTAAYIDPETKIFDKEKIMEAMTRHHIALNDTVRQAKRLKGNASDKFLHVVTPVPLKELLEKMPQCVALATTGEKAASILAEITGTQLPKMGEKVHCRFMDRDMTIYRMPSTSRAYPMKLEKKADYYRQMLHDLELV